ncbi:hypothetical protein JCM9533A_50710 [Catenuloplanes niger JCM 9533]
MDTGKPDLLKLTRVSLLSGEQIAVAEGLTVVVGPNNAGKSRLLQEIAERLTLVQLEPHIRPKVTAGIEVERRCEEEALIDWMRGRYKFYAPGSYPHGIYEEESFTSLGGPGVAVREIKRSWTSGQSSFGKLANFLLRHIPAGQAQSAVATSSSFNALQEAPTQPLQFLYANRDLERLASEEMRSAFGEHLTVNRYGGSQITLHVGTVAAEEGPAPASPEYLEEIKSLPLLQDQGDGVKSFMGMVLTVITAGYPLLLIDEPEAFLHPPQAYMLGRFLARQHDRGVQVIVATHSDDILRGIMSEKSSASAVTVVRLTRSSKGNHAAQVHVDRVQQVYEDPLIKYFGILDGLFSHGVMLCEAGSDCTYYRAVLESTVKVLDGGFEVSALSVHFAHCGGKTGIPKAVRALRAARVPVGCAVDIDFLQDDGDFTALVEACGGNSKSMQKNRSVVLAAIKSRMKYADKDFARFKITEILNNVDGDRIMPAQAAEIRSLITPSSGWKLFKSQGKALLMGEAAAAYASLDSALKSIGIFLVPVGELECFHRDVPSKDKAAWLRQVLESRAYEESAEATAYVKNIAEFIWQHQDQAATTEGKIIGAAD